MPICNWICHTAVGVRKSQRSLSLLDSIVFELSWLNYNNLWAFSTSFIEEEEDSCLQRSFKLRQFLSNGTLQRRSVSFCCILDRFFSLSSSTVSILWTSLNPNLSSVFASWKFEARSIFAFWKFESQPFFAPRIGKLDEPLLSGILESKLDRSLRSGTWIGRSSICLSIRRSLIISLCIEARYGNVAICCKKLSCNKSIFLIRRGLMRATGTTPSFWVFGAPA